MIYIIRHGQTELNQRQVLQGRSDFLLNDAGILGKTEATLAELADVCENSLPLPMRPFMLENETI